MLLTCLGHAKFLIELNSGLRIVTDPFDAACGYPLTTTAPWRPFPGTRASSARREHTRWKAA